jgi:hypothetical protein
MDVDIGNEGSQPHPMPLRGKSLNGPVEMQIACIRQCSHFP